MWWLGDWIRFADQKWGEKYDQAISLGFAYQTALNAVSVAKKFQFSRRREDLSWGHHEAVACLEEPFADGFLDDAITHKWSQKELRKQVADFRVKDGKYPIFTLDTPSQEAFSPAEVPILPAPGELGAKACARAASGHAVAPASPAMKSRRRRQMLIWPPVPTRKKNSTAKPVSPRCPATPAYRTAVGHEMRRSSAASATSL
jgi:hypothetical protein